MKTLHLKADDPEAVQHASELLQRGGLVAFATETVYGLGANALSVEAVRGIFRAKQRPSWDPLIVHLPDVRALGTVAQPRAEVAGRTQALAAAFWPGPLTMLLPRTSQVPDEVTAGRALVGVRIPAHPAAQALLRAAKLPIAAPSANRFGHISPTTAEHVLADLDGCIDAVLDAGPCQVGVESTVLDPATTPITVYRAGAVTVDAIVRCCGAPAALYDAGERVTHDEHAPSALPSPGVGLRHYAPRVPLQLSGGTPSDLLAKVTALRTQDLTVGVLLPRSWPLPTGQGVTVQPWGDWDDPASLASTLFAGLRTLETSGAAVLACPTPPPGGMNDALRDRLVKAARTKE